MPIRPRIALLAAAGCLALMALVWVAAFHLGFAQHADQAAYIQFGNLQGHGAIAWIAGHLVSLFEPDPYVYLALVPLLIALIRGRPRLVLAVAAILLGANGSTEVLKHVLAAPRAGSLFLGGVSPLSPVSWPSGHSTAAMSLVLASVLAVPARLRPAAAALGALLAVAVGYSVLAVGIHYPSDVIGGFLMATTWTLLAVAALMAAEQRWPSRRASSGPVSTRAALGAPGAVLVAAGAIGLILAISRPHDVIAYASAHPAFVFEAAAIAALSLVVSTAVMLSVRR